MFKSTVRAAPRRILSSRTQLSSSSSRRFLNTAPPAQKSRSWKSSAARWGLAAAGVYYYNTSNVFAEEPEAAIQHLDEAIRHVQESRQPTIDAIVEEKRLREAQEVEEKKRQYLAERTATKEGHGDEVQEGEEDLGSLEEEADQQGAFNPETGEINWDCPCLGGMAHGPCGEEFKAAFSCFVYSNEEPKGVECIEKFKGMQDCFRQHPDMYGSELEDDEDELDEEIRAQEITQASGEASAKSTSEPTPQTLKETSSPPTEEKKVTPETAHRDSQSMTAADVQKAGGEGDGQVPKAAYDATSK